MNSWTAFFNIKKQISGDGTFNLSIRYKNNNIVNQEPEKSNLNIIEKGIKSVSLIFGVAAALV